MATAQLSVMVKNLRAECGHSLSTTQGLNQVETLKYLLARTQEEMWTAFVWPDLVTRADIVASAGQYNYSYELFDMPFDSFRRVMTTIQAGANTNWIDVEYGISENLILPDDTNSERSDPIRYWGPDSMGSLRVWPTPNTAVRIRAVGQLPLNPFLADSDTSTLDSTAIVLLTAADLLARAKAEDADIKMQKAQRHITKLLGNKINAKNKISTLGGGVPRRQPQTGGILLGRGF